jgi:hypothetical protein
VLVDVAEVVLVIEKYDLIKYYYSLNNDYILKRAKD